MRLIACVTICLVPILIAAAQMAPQTSSDRQAYCVNRSADFYPIRVSPAKAAINSDQAIAGKQTGTLLPCQERSASHRAARSNYPLKTPLFPRPPRLAADARPEPIRVTSSKTRTEYLFSELPQITDIVASSNNRYTG
jgi:hypothetical protein